jgi:hypothetical protein
LTQFDSVHLKAVNVAEQIIVYSNESCDRQFMLRNRRACIEKFGSKFQQKVVTNGSGRKVAPPGLHDQHSTSGDEWSAQRKVRTLILADFR